MIDKETVFVLGAGASMPYGFPSGPMLRHEICSATMMPGDPRHKILMEMGFTYKQVEKCRIAIARSWASSIDMFIASRSDHAKVAKASIALTIAKYERDKELFFANPQGDWFRYLWRHLHDPSSPTFMPNELVSFVTFNYDRVLEHAFFNAIQHLRGQTRVSKAMLPQIVHVYGSLGEYPFADSNGNVRKFAARSTKRNIESSTESINVISDKTPESSLPARAQELLCAAKQVIFLGFGYDQDNLRVLRLLSDGCCIPRNARIYGTAMNLNEQEKVWVRKLMGLGPDPEFGGRNELGGPNVDCLMFLREHVNLLS